MDIRNTIHTHSTMAENIAVFAEELLREGRDDRSSEQDN